jgi:multidrug efflux pump subunit AcrB
MWAVRVALQRPYTFVVLAILNAIFSVRAALNTPTDILPSINIPVVSVLALTGTSRSMPVRLCSIGLTTFR